MGYRVKRREGYRRDDKLQSAEHSIQQLTFHSVELTDESRR
jgi:hypothetical protein